jgi:hypothetical protein
MHSPKADQVVSSRIVQLGCRGSQPAGQTAKSCKSRGKGANKLEYGKRSSFKESVRWRLWGRLGGPNMMYKEISRGVKLLREKVERPRARWYLIIKANSKGLWEGTIVIATINYSQNMWNALKKVFLKMCIWLSGWPIFLISNGICEYFAYQLTQLLIQSKNRLARHGWN